MCMVRSSYSVGSPERKELCIFIIFIRHDSRSFTSLNLQKVDATSTHGGFYQHN